MKNTFLKIAVAISTLTIVFICLFYFFINTYDDTAVLDNQTPEQFANHVIREKLTDAVRLYNKQKPQSTDIELSAYISSPTINRKEKIQTLIGMIVKFKDDREKSLYISDSLRVLRPVEAYKDIILLIKDNTNNTEVRASLIRTLQDFMLSDSIKYVADIQILQMAQLEINDFLSMSINTEQDHILLKQMAETLIAISERYRIEEVLNNINVKHKNIFSQYDEVSIQVNSTILDENRGSNDIKKLLDNISNLDNGKDVIIEQLVTLTKHSTFSPIEKKELSLMLINNEPSIKNIDGYDGEEVYKYGSWASTIAILNSNDYNNSLYEILTNSNTVNKKLSILTEGGDSFFIFLKEKNYHHQIIESLNENNSKLSDNWLDLKNDISNRLK